MNQSPSADNRPANYLFRAYRGSSDGFWEWDVVSGRVVFSDSFKGLLGFSSAEFPDRYESWESRLHPEDRAATLEALQQHLQGRGPYDVEYRLQCKTGEYRWFQARGQAEWDAQGQPLVMAGSITDVTGRKATEEELKSSQGLYLSLVENLPVFLIRKDLAGRFTFCNQAFCELLGKPREQILGSTDHDHFPAELADKYRRDDARVISSQRRFDDVEETRDGERRGYFQVIKVPILDAAGTVTGTQAVFWDVTDRKLAEEALLIAKEEAEQANRAKSEFVANMSHEIRTPLNAIIGMTELVLETELNPSQREYLRTVLDSGESLLAIINQILDFSKIEAGQLRLDVTRLELRELLGNTMKSLAVRGHRKGLELLLDVDERVPDLFLGDPMRLRQVVVNLVGNAIKFTEMGEVVLSVALLDEQTPPSQTTPSGTVELLIAVRDTGIGISAENQAKIFQAFQQADTSMTRRFGGTGLGLSIATELVEMMGGQIWVESELGSGSTFYFTVQLQLDPSTSQPLAIAANLSGYQALIVEPHATQRSLLEETLSGWQMSVQSTSSVKEALGRLRTLMAQPALPLVLITDAASAEEESPGRAARSLVELVRAEASLRDLPIIVLSASSARPSAQHVDRGLTIELHKPIKQSELLHALDRAFGIVRWSESGEKSGGPEAAQRPLRILVAEDGLANQQLIRGILSRWGHELTCVTDGQQALQAWEEGAFDVILMDVQMPELDGYEATRRIRQREQELGRGRTPILAVTAHSLSGDEQKCMTAGMDGYVSKPVRQDALRQALAGVEPRGVSQAEGDSVGRRDAFSRRVDPAESDGEGLDLKVALETVGGDRELLQLVFEAMQEEMPELLEQLQLALDAEDATTARRAAHTIKGSSRIMPHTAAHRLAAEAELWAQQGQLDRVRERLPELSEAVAALLRCLAGVSSEPG